MKKIATLILFLTVSCIVFSQENQLEYTAEVPVDNATAKELHDRCIDWAASYFNNSGEVVVQSAEDKIIARSRLLYYPTFYRGSDPITGTITYTFEVAVSDGKFTYLIHNFVHHGNPLAVYQPINFGLITTARLSPIKFPNQMYSERIWKDIKSQIAQQVMALIANLKVEMNKSAEKKEN